MNTNDKKNNYRIKLDILFDNNNIATSNHNFNLIVQLLDVTFEDVINKKLEFVFDVEIHNLNKIYSFFILVDIDKNNKISIGDYISTDRHLFIPQDNNFSLQIKVY